MTLENKLGITNEGELVDWSKVNKEDYLLAMERSPIKDVEIKVLLKAALTDKINNRKDKKWKSGEQTLMILQF